MLPCRVSVLLSDEAASVTVIKKGPVSELLALLAGVKVASPEGFWGKHGVGTRNENLSTLTALFEACFISAWNTSARVPSVFKACAVQMPSSFAAELA